MNNASNQTVQINLGLCWNQNGKSGEFDQELGRFLVENKFPHCGIISEPYVDSWQSEDSGEMYRDNCLAFSITVPHIHRMTLGSIELRVALLRIVLRQDSVAFTTTYAGNTYSDVFCGFGDKPEGAYAFDPAKFHYVK